MLADGQLADHMGSKAIVQAFVDAVNNQDWQAIETLVAASFTRHSIAAGEIGVHSRLDLIKFLRAEYNTFPDANEQIVDILGEGDKVAVRMRFRGTQVGILGTYPRPASASIPSPLRFTALRAASSSKLGPNGTT